MDHDNPYKDDEKDLEAAKSMDEISKTVFAPIYPLIAGQIKEKFNITEGNCIDIGSGPAALSIALARITNLQVNAMDASKHSFKIAESNIADQDLESRVTALIGKAEKIPFKDNFADLIVSRGSIFFWDDLIKAFNEILRVLKPGGKTYIGGGFGNPELKEAIFEEMAKTNDSFSKKGKGKLTPENIERIKKAVEESNVQKYDITHGDAGFWIHITKE
ncbi:MAG: class I SAM-dependent methyltransferase [Desulfobacteraceae bacterium]|nr:class I SAM-dependent methyltransferase [Desulfobacteraceae bacterium]